MSTQASFGERFSLGWTATYTRGLPSSAADRRQAEIESDIWE
jgi:hypothetical protein